MTDRYVLFFVDQIDEDKDYELIFPTRREAERHVLGLAQDLWSDRCMHDGVDETPPKLADLRNCLAEWDIVVRLYEVDGQSSKELTIPLNPQRPAVANNSKFPN